jgi:hypothetical protein
MTPEQWFAATEPDPLLVLVDPSPVLVGNAFQYPPPRSPATTRRLRLFATACARMVWDILPTDARSAVLISERFANGRASESDVRASAVRSPSASITFQQHALEAAGYASARTHWPQDERPLSAMWDPAPAARSTAYALATRAAGPAPPPGRTSAIRDWHTTWNQTYHAARATQAAFVRDIFPPPAYAPRIDRDWLTSTVVALARQMDESGDFSATPILADALQDAGCDDETVLQCCRVPGNVHVRGNWVVDVVLGRA